MIFFKILFYGFGLFLAFVEYYQFKNSAMLSEKMRDFSDWSKSRKLRGESTEWNDVPKDLKKYTLFRVILSITELIWLTIGLFTFNWAFYASYMIFLWIIATLFRGSKPSQMFYGFRSILFIAFALFVALNSFHLHINILTLF